MANDSKAAAVTALGNLMAQGYDVDPNRTDDNGARDGGYAFEISGIAIRPWEIEEITSITGRQMSIAVSMKNGPMIIISASDALHAGYDDLSSLRDKLRVLSGK